MKTGDRPPIERSGTWSFRMDLSQCRIALDFGDRGHLPLALEAVAKPPAGQEQSAISASEADFGAPNGPTPGAWQGSR